MFLKKVFNEGKVAFVEITKEEAKELKNQGKDVLMIDEDFEEDAIDDAEDELEEEEEDNEENDDDDEDEDNEVEEKNNTYSHFDYSEIKNCTSRAGNYECYNQPNSTKNSKMNKLMRALPFMDKEDIHEVLQKILEGDECLKDINISLLLPYLSDEDCDKVFLKAISDGNTKINPSSITPYVSSKCLSLIVDKYVNGEYPDLDIDSLYPFLNSKDIKKIFNYVLNQKDN